MPSHHPWCIDPKKKITLFPRCKTQNGLSDCTKKRTRPSQLRFRHQTSWFPGPFRYPKWRYCAKLQPSRLHYPINSKSAERLRGPKIGHQDRAAWGTAELIFDTVNALRTRHSSHENDMKMSMLQDLFERSPGEKFSYCLWRIMTGGFHKWGIPKLAGWFVLDNPIKMDDLGVPLFLETSILRWYLNPCWRIGPQAQQRAELGGASGS